MLQHLKALATALVLVAISAGIATIAVPEKEKIPVATEPLPPPPLIAAIVIAVEGDKKVEVAPPTAPFAAAVPKEPPAAPSPWVPPAERWERSWNKERFERQVAELREEKLRKEKEAEAGIMTITITIADLDKGTAKLCEIIAEGVAAPLK